MSDGIHAPGITSGFRVRQALWDLEDDIRDVQQDRNTIGANVLLMSTIKGNDGLKTLADSLYEQALVLPIPKPLVDAIKEQYQKTLVALEAELSTGVA